MSVEKGSPPAHTAGAEFADALYELAKQAFADKGEWYSIPIPDGKLGSSVISLAVGVMARTAGKISTKADRVWMRFEDEE